MVTFVKLQQYVIKNVEDEEKDNLLENLTKIKEDYFSFFSHFQVVTGQPHLQDNVQKLLEYYKNNILNPLLTSLLSIPPGSKRKKHVLKIHIKFLIFISKAKILLKLFHNVLLTNEDQLFTQFFDQTDWKLIVPNIEEIVK